MVPVVPALSLIASRKPEPTPSTRTAPESAVRVILQAAAYPAGFEPLLTAADVGEILRKHPRTILRWAREGKLPARKLGSTWMFRASTLDALFADGVVSVSSQSARAKEK